MVAISAFRVTQRSQIFSLFFRNRIQCIVLYQLHNSQALLNLAVATLVVNLPVFMFVYITPEKDNRFSKKCIR